MSSKKGLRISNNAISGMENLTCEGLKTYYRNHDAKSKSKENAKEHSEENAKENDDRDENEEER